VFRLRELVHKNREAQQQDAASRRDAEADAEAIATRVRKLEASLERLRGTRQQTLLDTIKEERADFAEQTATYLAKIAMLSKRREDTMRKVSDINLSNRRAALGTETAKQAQQALNDYCVRDLASDIDLARLEMVEAELVATRAELVKEKALRVKYEAVAHPPKEYFFKSGAYTTRVDLTALKAIADLNVARRAVPKLFKLFADDYNITLPSRPKKMRVADVNGERRFELRDVLHIPGQTHVNELPEVVGMLHQVQVKQAAHRPVEFLFFVCCAPG